MPGRDREHSRRPVLRLLGVLLVLALVAGGVAVWRLDLVDEWLDDEPDAAPEPAAVAPPPGLELPPVAEPAAVAAGLPRGPRLDLAAVRRALLPELGDRDLGRHVVAVVAPLTGGAPAYTLGRGAAMPASTTKVVTSAAALYALGSDHVFETTVVADRGRVVLVGGGDPYLASAPDDAETPYPPRADVVTLARRTARALRQDGVRRVAVGYDDGLFTGPSTNPTWRPEYYPDEAAPTSALWVDQGRPPSDIGRVPDPPLAAAEAFAAALAREGIRVTGSPARVRAPATEPIARVAGAPLGQVVERLLDVSDNNAAEVLLRHVGLAQEGAGSIEAGLAGVRRVLEANGIALRSSELHDGSGLSRSNRLHPAVLVDVLRLAAGPEHPDLRPVLTGLPVAGFTGSLADRMDLGPPAGRGRVRAKTGTLTGVTSLAGIAGDLDGTAMAFALMADRVRKDRDYFARVAMDNAAAALGACRCGR